MIYILQRICSYHLHSEFIGVRLLLISSDLFKFYIVCVDTPFLIPGVENFCFLDPVS